MIRAILTLGLAGGLLAACTQAPAGSTSPWIDLSKPEKVGYLVGSVGANGQASDVNQYLLRICDDSRHVVADVVYNTRFGLQGPELTTGDFRGDSFVVALPEGRYEICEGVFRLSQQYSRLNAILRGTGRGTPLIVKARETTYIGRFIGSPTVTYDLLEGRRISAAYWEASDAQAQDLPAILKKLPADAPRPVVAVLPQSSLQPPVFRPKP